MPWKPCVFIGMIIKYTNNWSFESIDSIKTLTINIKVNEMKKRERREIKLSKSDESLMMHQHSYILLEYVWFMPQIYKEDNSYFYVDNVPI